MMRDFEKIKKGLECCKVSMDDEAPFEKCDVCPYNEIGISVQDCRSVLSADCIDLFKWQNQRIKELEAISRKSIGK